MLKVMAAGSLRRVWAPLMTRFETETGMKTQTRFGPAGLLRQRIEAGEECDLFASANLAHPLALKLAGLAQEVHPFAGNRLCLTVAKQALHEGEGWLDLLRRDELRLATSTPVSDPSGDYTWQFFERIEQLHPGSGERLKERAQQLVGGPSSLKVPEGELASAWLIRRGYADIFIGYLSYAPALRGESDVAVVDIPLDYNIRSVYALAQCQGAAKPLADYLLSDGTQRFLVDAGFET
ncbi:MAG TPA: substrate-binding domain-containing protein [Buttiauxella sp.]|jgi:molybdate transport system substrate-binding protein